MQSSGNRARKSSFLDRATKVSRAVTRCSRSGSSPEDGASNEGGSALRKYPHSHKSPLSSSLQGRNGQPAAVGTVRFRGSRRRMARWVKCSSASSPDQIYTLLTKTWSTPLPGAIISAIGHSVEQDIGVDNRLDDVGDVALTALRKGLSSVAQKTRAWVLTDGQRAGASRVIGRAVESTNGVTVIGFTSWNSVEGKTQLLKEAGRMPSVYTSATVRAEDSSRDGSSVCLEPNHTHFVFAEGDEPDEAGPHLLDEFNQFMRTHDVAGENQAGTPGVFIVIGGDVRTLRAVHTALCRKQAMPDRTYTTGSREPGREMGVPPHTTLRIPFPTLSLNPSSCHPSPDTRYPSPET